MGQLSLHRYCRSWLSAARGGASSGRCSFEPGQCGLLSWISFSGDSGEAGLEVFHPHLSIGDGPALLFLFLDPAFSSFEALGSFSTQLFENRSDHCDVSGFLLPGDRVFGVSVPFGIDRFDLLDGDLAFSNGRKEGRLSMVDGCVEWLHPVRDTGGRNSTAALSPGAVGLGASEVFFFNINSDCSSFADRGFRRTGFFWILPAEVRTLGSLFEASKAGLGK